MIFEKNKYRLQQLEQKLKVAHTESERISILRSIEKYKKKGEEWHVKFRDSFGKWRAEKVPAQYRGKRGADRYEKIKVVEVDRGEYYCKNLRMASIEEICDYYLDTKMKTKASYSSAKTICGNIKRHLGLVRLNRLNIDPEFLIDFFNDFPETEWAPKYIWNYRATLRAAIAHWLKMKRVIMANPIDLVEIEKGTKVMDYVPTKQDFESIIMASYTVGLPDAIRNIYVAVYETGLRINEILVRQLEDISLEVPIFDADGKALKIPYYSTFISKQHKKVKVQLPMSKPLFNALRNQIGNRHSGSVWQVEQSRLYETLREANLLKEAKVSFDRPFHDFRKTVKHRLKVEMLLGKEISKNFMGHATDAMDDYYTHFNKFDLWCAVEDSWQD